MLCRRSVHLASSTSGKAFFSVAIGTDQYDSSDAFYDTQANLHRRYFYTIDLRGYIYLSSAKHKNFATALKDTKFLRTIHMNLEANSTTMFSDRYSYISRCGREVNFMHHQDERACVGFSHLSDDCQQLLYAGGSLAQPFQPEKLAFSHASGRIYHPILAHKKLGSDMGHWGLLHPSLIAELSRHITVGDSRVQLDWRGTVYDIRDLK